MPLYVRRSEERWEILPYDEALYRWLRECDQVVLSVRGGHDFSLTFQQEGIQAFGQDVSYQGFATLEGRMYLRMLWFPSGEKAQAIWRRATPTFVGRWIAPDPVDPTVTDTEDA